MRFPPVLGLIAGRLFRVISARQAQVLGCTAEGMRVEDIASELQISVGAVKKYRGQAYRALGVHSAPAAVSEAFRLGYLRPDGRSAPPLSDRELQVVAATANGLNGDQVAAQLGIVLATVKAHYQNITARLNARSAAHVVAICHHAGLLLSLPPQGPDHHDQARQADDEHRDRLQRGRVDVPARHRQEHDRDRSPSGGRR